MKLDPELIPFFEALPPLDLISDIPAARAMLRARAAANPPQADDRFQSRDTTVDGPDGNWIPIRIYTPTSTGERLFPLLIYTHGGCFITGDLDTADSQCRPICAGANAIVISVDYRLAPEHPFPAQLDDCYAVLLWAVDRAAELGIDPARIAVGGRSAGGCLATAMTLRAREENGPGLIYQLLLVPALDDRLETPSSHTITDERVLNRETCEAMWTFYLQGMSPEAPYAIPMRAKDLTGLPPAGIVICQHDPLRDEALEFANRLLAAGVPTEIQLIPGAYHVFETQAPRSRLAVRATNAWVAAVDHALNR